MVAKTRRLLGILAQNAVISLCAGTAIAATGTSSLFPLDLRESPRDSAGTETLQFSATYDGLAANTVKIGLDGDIFQTASGSGSVNWSTNRVGAYTFTHTAYSGTTAVGQVLSASFIIPGPHPSVSWRAAANEGVTAQIDGNLEGWTMRYTTDGSEPTASSPVYSAPIPVQAPTIITAKAFSDGGLVSETVSRVVGYSFAESPTITSVSARQRYPWNGLVDVDVSFEGPTGRVYRIELSATDKAGGTNLTMRTVSLAGSSGGAGGNPVDVPAPGTHRLVWNAAADLPSGFVSDRVTFSAKLLNPIWSFESIPAVNPDDYWAPETVYHDVQTVASYGEIENHTPTIRCLTDEWNLEHTLGSNVVFSGASMGLRNTYGTSWWLDLYQATTNPIALFTFSSSTNQYRIVTLDYETGEVVFDAVTGFGRRSADARFFSLKEDHRTLEGNPRIYAILARDGWHSILKSADTDKSSLYFRNRYGDDEAGSALCNYFPKGIPFADASRATMLSDLDKNFHMGVFFCGVSGTDIKQTICICGSSSQMVTNSLYSCMKNPTGRYVVPMLDGTNYFTVGHGASDTNNIQYLRLFAGHFGQRNGETFDLGSRYREDWPAGYESWPQTDKSARIHNWVREPSVAYSKGVAMPDGKRIFLGGAGRDADGKVRMWQDGTNVYGHANYPSGHAFESWARRDVTCLLPNGKFCGVDEELGLVVVNPLTGEMYVASDDPVFKKGKMGCQLLPNGKVWIIPYDCEGREFEAGLAICGKLYEVDFGFTRSFSLSSLCSPYLKVAEGDPEPSGIKVGLDPNGGELPGIYAQYYKGVNPVYGTLPAPFRTGYAFLGWSTDGAEAGIVATTDPVPQSGILLQAVWRAQ